MNREEKGRKKIELGNTLDTLDARASVNEQRRGRKTMTASNEAMPMVGAGWCEEFGELRAWLDEAGLEVDRLPTWHEAGNVAAVAYDPYKLHCIALHLRKADVRMVPMPQTTKGEKMLNNRKFQPLTFISVQLAVIAVYRLATPWLQKRLASSPVPPFLISGNTITGAVSGFSWDTGQT